MAANAAAWVAGLAEGGLSSLLVIDEPGLHVFGTRGLEDAWDPLRAIAPVWGLHLCCAVPWELVTDATPDVLSFDLAREPIDRRASNAIGALLARGGRIAWGVVAPQRTEHAPQAIRSDQQEAVKPARPPTAGTTARSSSVPGPPLTTCERRDA